MTVQYGIWEVSNGKGDRHYIKCLDGTKIIHGDLFDINGVGVYGYDVLQDLAVAILKFEKLKNQNESIINKLEKIDD